MNQLFLLKLISDLLKDAKPTQEKIDCARQIVTKMIEELEKEPDEGNVNFVGGHFSEGQPGLDNDAEKARRELMDG